MCEASCRSSGIGTGRDSKASAAAGIIGDTDRAFSGDRGTDIDTDRECGLNGEGFVGMVSSRAETTTGSIPTGRGMSRDTRVLQKTAFTAKLM